MLCFGIFCRHGSALLPDQPSYNWADKQQIAQYGPGEKAFADEHGDEFPNQRGRPEIQGDIRADSGALQPHIPGEKQAAVDMIVAGDQRNPASLLCLLSMICLEYSRFSRVVVERSSGRM